MSTNWILILSNAEMTTIFVLHIKRKSERMVGSVHSNVILFDNNNVNDKYIDWVKRYGTFCSKMSTKYIFDMQKWQLLCFT